MLNKRSSFFKQGRFDSHSQSANHRSLAFLWLFIVLLSAALLVKQWGFSGSVPIETNIMKLLPDSRQDPIAQAAFDKVTTSVSDKVVFVLTAPDDQQLFEASDFFSQSLSQLNTFKQVTGKITQEQQNAWSRYYFEHRYQFLTTEQRDRLTTTPEKQVQTVVQSIYNPFSGVTGQELSHDPFLLFRDYLSYLNQLSTQFTINQGYLTTQYQKQTYVLITADLSDSPYSMNAQNAVSLINQLQQTIKQKYDVDSAHTGVLFYADFGTQSAKSEISTIGVVSLLGVVFLILVVFRSATPLLLALLSITVGLLVALATTTAIFGKVHLFSLVFGASLIGVSIDYAFHYLTDRLAAKETWNSFSGLKHIFSAITLGLITSLIGYLGLLIAPFPGLQQLALFSAIGLIGAYTTVVTWYPFLARKPTSNRSLPANNVWAFWLNLWQKRSLRVMLPTLICLISSLALTQIQYNDDIRQLQAMPLYLKQQEQLISDISGLESSQQMLVITAKDDQSLLSRLEILDTTFNSWINDNTLSGYQSLNQYIASTNRQEQDFNLVQNLYQTYAASLAHSLQLTQTPKLEQHFTPVTLSEYLNQSVSKPVQHLYLGKINDQVASVVMLRGVSDAQAIKSYAAQHSDISYLDKTGEISQLFGEYRTKIMELLVVALLAISLLLTRRYGFSHMILIVMPCLIACMAGLAVTVMTGSALNLFNLLALVLVIGIGIDYTLFFAEQAQSRSTLLAITLSAMTTLLSFGLLALSQTHAIHSFGLTTLSGIFVAWLLSPLAIKRNSQ